MLMSAKVPFLIQGLTYDWTARTNWAKDEILRRRAHEPFQLHATSNASDWETTVDCRHGCLFNLTSDPTETRDLASAQPATVARMLARIEAINATAFSPIRGTSDPRGCDVAVHRYGGFWGPFAD